MEELKKLRESASVGCITSLHNIYALLQNADGKNSDYSMIFSLRELGALGLAV